MLDGRLSWWVGVGGANFGCLPRRQEKLVVEYVWFDDPQY